MTHIDQPDEWQPWIEEACRAVGIDPSLVDANAILALTKVVAQRFTRPMAPVAAYILGVATAVEGPARSGQLAQALMDTLPTPTA